MKIQGYNGPANTVIVEMELTTFLYAELASTALLLGISDHEALEKAVLRLASDVRRDLADLTSHPDPMLKYRSGVGRYER